MEKVMRFFEKPHQGLPNAPTPKCFGQIFAEIIGFEVLKITPAKRVSLGSQEKKPPLKTLIGRESFFKKN